MWETGGCGRGSYTNWWVLGHGNDRTGGRAGLMRRIGLFLAGGGWFGWLDRSIDEFWIDEFAEVL
jgi:hypothetical protein